MEMLEWVISSAVLTALIIALRFVLRGKISLRLQYALWALVLLRLLIPVNFGSTGISVMNAIEGTAADPVSRASAVVGYIGGETPDLSVVEPDPYASPEEQAAQYEANRQAWQTEIDAARTETGMPVTVSGILTLIWLSGAAVMALWLLIFNLRFSARLHRSRHTLVVDSCALPVYVSEIIDTPCLFGLFRPCVYVTSAVAGNDTVLRHSVEHETTHFRHGDHIWSLLRGACLAIHWYNPLVWWAAVLSRSDAELACDEATIERIGENERAEYGRTLIGMTCQKRPALLLTATTMTGSKSSIKERIMLIAKKPKTAIYTLIAVVLIAAVAVGCTFTGANADTPWAWAQSIDANDVSVYIWYSTNNEKQLTDTEKETLISMLNSLKQGNFTQNKELAGITPGYGLRITTDDTDYYINEANAQSGSLEMNYGGKQWWINSDELYSFISALATGGGQELSVKAEVDDDIPKAVIDYATDYTRTQLLYYTDDLGYDITEAKIVGLTQITTGTAGLDNGINMYCLEYRLLTADPEEVMLAGGMQMDGDYITEWGSTGQPYLLLHWQDNDSETMWERICVTNTDVITQDYGTPEMIEQYGDKYTAAAMELYKKHESGGDTSPTDALDSLFASGDVALTLNLANDGAYNTYLADEWYSGRLKVLLSGYEWTELRMPLTEPSDFWLTAVSADGAKSMTFWANSGAGTVQYDDGNTTTCWSASPANEYSTSIAEDIRLEYDNLDVDYSRIAFSLDDSAEEAADFFVHSAYGSHMMSLAPGNMYGMSDYDVVQWEVREVSADGDAVVGSFQCAFTPWGFNSSGIWAGNTAEGTGEYEGKLTFYREFVLQRQEDGYWHCIGLGTGGYTLPE